MTVSTGAFMGQIYGLVKGLGDKSVASDAVFVIAGYEHLRLLIKSFPWPILSPGDAIEIPMPNGGMTGQPSQTKTFFQGQVSMHETVQGHVSDFAKTILAQGGRFNATLYEGTMENPIREASIVDCWFTFEPGDRDWENRTQATMFTAQLSYNYFGETKKSNS